MVMLMLLLTLLRNNGGRYEDTLVLQGGTGADISISGLGAFHKCLAGQVLIMCFHRCLYTLGVEPASSRMRQLTRFHLWQSGLKVVALFQATCQKGQADENRNLASFT